MTPAIELREASRAFGNVVALDRVSLSVAPGEFFALLGPSGSGKTTCLRLIAGFDQPDSGRVLLDGDDVTDSPPFARNVNTVFQDYALFPHMSVAENVAYGLKVRGVAARERESRATDMLELVRLGDLGRRRPHQLSGGQRQRVALARALINHPKVLLLDEPLGALDLKLREEMQTELKGLQQRLGITFVFVTHDQGEALSMADRVAVFSQGRIEQLDTPRALYNRPRTAFVANFVGSANVVDAEAARELTGQPHAFAIRPELIEIVAPGASLRDGSIRCEGVVLDVLYHGASSRCRVRLGNGTTLAVAQPEAAQATAGLVVGAPVRLAWRPEVVVPLQD
ncbi:MAG TPA: ABC transporter ATP-binding protein [Steroidobacteraceae bacterium]|nr:ABC transporter ATP-binding protein [Steroidobacteraceae bacterium]